MSVEQYSLMKSIAAGNAAAGWHITFDLQATDGPGEARLTRRMSTYRDHPEPYRCHMFPAEDGAWGYTVLSAIDSRVLESGEGRLAEVFKLLSNKS